MHGESSIAAARPAGSCRTTATPLGFPASDTIADPGGPAAQPSLSSPRGERLNRKVNIFRCRLSCRGSGSRWNVHRSTVRLESFGADMPTERRTHTCRQRSWMRLCLGSWPDWSRGSPLANSGSWMPWPTAFRRSWLEPLQWERTWQDSDLSDWRVSDAPNLAHSSSGKGPRPSEITPADQPRRAVVLHASLTAGGGLHVAISPGRSSHCAWPSWMSAPTPSTWWWKTNRLDLCTSRPRPRDAAAGRGRLPNHAPPRGGGRATHRHGDPDAGAGGRAPRRRVGRLGHLGDPGRPVTESRRWGGCRRRPGWPSRSCPGPRRRA